MADTRILGVECRALRLGDRQDEVFCSAMREYVGMPEGVRGKKRRLELTENEEAGTAARVCYRYCLGRRGPLFWKKTRGGRCVQKLEKDKNGDFSVDYYGSGGGLEKKESYRQNGEWYKTEYFGKDGDPLWGGRQTATIEKAPQPGTLYASLASGFGGLQAEEATFFDLLVCSELDNVDRELTGYVERNTGVMLVGVCTVEGVRFFCPHNKRKLVFNCVKGYCADMERADRILFPSCGEQWTEEPIAEESHEPAVTDKGTEAKGENSAASVEKAPLREGAFCAENVTEKQAQPRSLRYEIAGPRLTVSQWEKEALAGTAVQTDRADSWLTAGYVSPEGWHSLGLQADWNKNRMTIGTWNCGSLYGIDVIAAADEEWTVKASGAEEPLEASRFGPDGTLRYTGEWKEEKPEGLGAGKNQEGWYLGSWKAGIPSGVGACMECKTGKISVADWQGNIPRDTVAIFDEQGRLLYAGQMKEHMRCGMGTAKDPMTGEVFIGNWEKGCLHGMGASFSAAGVLQYNGMWKNGCRWGRGTLYTEKGSIRYYGEWENNRYHGTGALYEENGSRLEGNFIEGIFCGHGVKVSADGTVCYEGEWVQGVPGGKGKQYLPDGGWIEGEFTQGVLAGEASRYNKQGELLYRGRFHNDCYEGEGIQYLENGGRYEGRFQGGAFHGKGKLFSPDNVLEYFGGFSDGVPQGIGIGFSGGIPVYYGQWENGVRQGCGMEYENGKLNYVGQYAQNQKHGRINQVTEGKVRGACIYKHGAAVFGILYHENGRPYYLGSLKNGVCHGMGCMFNEYCEVVEQGLYHEGEFLQSIPTQLQEPEALECPAALKNTEFFTHLHPAEQYRIHLPYCNGFYSGRVEGDLPEGAGTFVCADHRYTGRFVQGVACGKGTIYKNTGEVLEGIFVQPREDACHIILSGMDYYVKKESVGWRLPAKTNGKAVALSDKIEPREQVEAGDTALLRSGGVSAAEVLRNSRKAIHRSQRTRRSIDHRRFKT